MKCHVLSCSPSEMSCSVMARRASGPSSPRPHGRRPGFPPSPRPPSRGPASILAAAPDRVRARPRRFGPPSIGRGGIGSRRWTPAFAGVTKKARNAPPCVERGHIAHRSSVSVPFSPPPDRPAGGSLFRAYRGRARARVGAGAVRAPDCAREAEDAPLPRVSQGFFENGAARPRDTGEAAPDTASSGFISVSFS